jgi:hypothetical protein
MTGDRYADNRYGSRVRALDGGSYDGVCARGEDLDVGGSLM